MSAKVIQMNSPIHPVFNSLTMFKIKNLMYCKSYSPITRGDLIMDKRDMTFGEVEYTSSKVIGLLTDEIPIEFAQRLELLNNDNLPTH